MRRSLMYLSVCVLLLATPVFAVAEQTLEIGNGERLLVLAPHPDDETLSSAGVIQQVLQHGGSVRSTVVTSGDGYVGAVMLDSGKRNPSAADYLDFGEKRLEESRRAANILGNGFVHLDLLGFSDGSIYSALVSHWRRNNPMRSEFTGFDHVPYRQAEDRGFAQDGQDLLNELVAILQDTKPTVIAFPDVMENDSDHAGLGMFTLLAVHNWLLQNPTQHPQPKLLAYLIHWQHDWPTGSNWGIPQDWSDQPLVLPPDLPLRGHSRACVNLSPAQINLKRAALAEYKTQQRIMGDFLSAFVRSSECFTLLKPSAGNRIEQVLKHWRQVRKAFDNHPLSRRKI
ncbi:PIG-L deacetylase family protein [Methylomonas rosea]|uniref:PIG-L family deacetylase n=1 Tax=Methylomonas rosea TaxID=2952227 RepID=A0ABT1TXX6_9GAMM|nr:PIG-L family deacetylase [Methylomonas sp. WSC-7]MCQ8119622.1 PIG-L family deacetylase [Methylomonas sp. WSC-7]